MQRKSREEQVRIASVTIKWENLVPGLRKVDDYDGLTWVYLECGTCSFIYFDLIDWQCMTCFVLKRGVICSKEHLNWFFQSVCRGFGLHILHIVCRQPIQCDTVSQSVIADANLFRSVCRWVSFEPVLYTMVWRGKTWIDVILVSAFLWSGGVRDTAATRVAATWEWTSTESPFRGHLLCWHFLVSGNVMKMLGK